MAKKTKGTKKKAPPRAAAKKAVKKKAPAKPVAKKTAKKRTPARPAAKRPAKPAPRAAKKTAKRSPAPKLKSKSGKSQSPFNLPADAVEFFRRGDQLRYDPSDCEPGEVLLKGLRELSLGEIWLEADTPGDPNAGMGGYYSIPAVSLTGECVAFDPEFILLWLPNERLFGTWDCDHWKLLVFPKVKWADIVAKPAPYLDVQWHANQLVTGSLTPWTDYKFKPGKPF